MISGCDGNVSYKDERNKIIITPSGVPKNFLSENDLSEISLDGKTLKGCPSSEKFLHLEIYKRAPQAQWIIHAHPSHAVAWSIYQPELKELPSEYLSEVILGVGTIPIVPYARPGSISMADSVAPYLPSHRVMILSRHGALSWGETPEEALVGMERIESSAKILYLAKTLGALSPLPDEEIKALHQLRKSLGEKNL